VCMPMSGKFLAESTCEKIVKIGQYLGNIMDIVKRLAF